MSRSIFIGLALVTAGTVSLAAACDKSGTDAQNQVNEAQNKANTTITNAVVGANDKAAQAQAEADKKIAAAQADFATTREDYRHKMQTNLDALQKEMDDIAVKARTSTGQKKVELEATLPALRAQRDAFVADYNTLNNASATTWDATKVRLDKEWADLKAAVDKAD